MTDFRVVDLETDFRFEPISDAAKAYAATLNDDWRPGQCLVAADREYAASLIEDLKARGFEISRHQYRKLAYAV